MRSATTRRQWQLIGVASVVLALATGVAFAQDSVLLGTDGDDVISGTPAADSLYGRGGNDQLSGAAGDDDLDGGAGADLLSGGPGGDAVSYSGPTGVSVTLDGNANDGVPNEGDNVAGDVEDIFGGDGPDKLTGNSLQNTIDGGPGDDRITGGARADALFGNDGDDTINSKDGSADRVDCGAGQDSVVPDAKDVLVGCEDRGARSSTPVFLLNRVVPNGTGRRVRQLRLSGVRTRSRVVVACVSGCRPPRRPTRAVVQRASVPTRNTIALVSMPASPALVGGSTFEVGVRAVGAGTRCVRFRLRRSGSRLGGLVRLTVGCTSVAKG